MNSKLNIGDLLYRSKGLVEHVGVFLGNNKVVHSSPDYGISIDTLDDFSKNKTVKIVSVTDSNKNELATRLQRLLSYDSNYDLFANNCEHVASYLINGRKLSPQLQASIALSLFGGILAFTTNKPIVRSMIVSLLIGVLFKNAFRKYDYYLQK